jgi:hypothetical protein
MAYPISWSAIDDTFPINSFPQYMNTQIHEDHEVSRRARRKDTLSAEDLGILLQWHWKYGTLIFPTERRRCNLSLLKLWSSFIGSRPATLVANGGSALNDSQESPADDLSNNILRDDSNGDTLVGGKLELKT